jgi:small subunit ribosomal protein S6
LLARKAGYDPKGGLVLLREYEFTYISKADLQEADKSKHFAKYEALLTADGGQILKRDDWGVKKLAFPIKKQFRGHYVHYDFIGRPDHLAEVERLMRIDENVLRFLSIKIGENVDPEKRKAELANRAEQIKKLTTKDNTFGG